jgi:DNA-binding IclR family transcriptional regulator
MTTSLTSRTSDTQPASPGSVPALDRSLDILELLADTPAGLTLSDFSHELDIPKNAVFRITQTLLARGYLCRDPLTLAFSLSPKLLRLAPPHFAKMSLPEVSRDIMAELRDQTRETIQLGVLSGLEGVIIDQVEGHEPLRIVVNLGLRFPLYNNAPGKLLLAHMPEKEREATIAQLKLTANTPRTITTKKALREECQRVLEQGYSIDYAEADEGVHCIAGPIFGEDLTLAGTLWITGPSKRLPKARFKELGAQVTEAGGRISQLIATRGGST